MLNKFFDKLSSLEENSINNETFIEAITDDEPVEENEATMTAPALSPIVTSGGPNTVQDQKLIDPVLSSQDTWSDFENEIINTEAPDPTNVFKRKDYMREAIDRVLEPLYNNQI